MKEIKELKKYLLENFVDEYGDLMIRHLDLSDFDGNVYRGYWKVKGDLRQRANKVKGDLHQDSNEVKGDLDQYGNEVWGNLHQADSIVKGKTYTDFDKHTEVMKLENDDWVTDFIPEVDYDSLTKEELITMLKEKGEK